MKRTSSEDDHSSPIKRLTQTTSAVMTTFLAISTNADLMVLIFKMLSFHDQLRLSFAADHLKEIYRRFVIRHQYRILKISKVLGYYIVRSDSNEKQYFMSQGELQDFVKVFGEDVHKLTISCCGLYDIRQFPNLKSLSCCGSTINSLHKYMELVAKNFPQLEELCLNWSVDGESKRDLDVSCLLKMNKLRSLSIFNVLKISSAITIKYQLFRQLITKKGLESVLLDATIVPDMLMTALDRVPTGEISARELMIETPMEMDMWPTKFFKFLTNFERLSYLSIKITDTVRQVTLDAIAHTCTNLQALHFTDTEFGRITTFPLPPNLSELSLHTCSGFTCDNFHQLLTENRLTSFTSLYTHYRGDIRNFVISPHVKSLNLSGVHIDHFNTAFQNNTTLEKLVWHSNIADAVASALLLGSSMRMDVLRQKCIIPIGRITELRRLNKLVLLGSAQFLNWTYIHTLLTHPSLTELVIRDNYDCPAVHLLVTMNVPEEAIITNLVRLSLPFKIFFWTLDYWMELLTNNTNLELTIFDFNLKSKMLKMILTHASFPKNIKSIEISGFKIDRNEIWGPMLTNLQCDQDRSRHLVKFYRN